MPKLFVFLFLAVCIALATSLPAKGGSSAGSFNQCKLKCGEGRVNPVCGTDGESYPNVQVLECYKGCGRNVEFASAGFCKKHLKPSKHY